MLSIGTTLSKKISSSPSGRFSSQTGSSLIQGSLPRTSVRSFATGFPPYLLNIPATKVTTISNGLKVATEENHGETASIGVWVDAGAVRETEKTNGVAHFLEHMTFKGTKNRSKEKFELEIENMGGHLNAYTSREHTAFFMRVFKNDVPKAVDILSDIMTNATYSENYIEAERGTIIREAEEVAKNYNESIFDHVHSAAFQGTPLARGILGSIDNIKNIQRDDIVSYVKNNYHGPRMVLCGSGAVKHEELVALANKHFSSLPNTVQDPSTVTLAKPEFVGSMINIRDDSLEKLYLVLAVEGVSWTSPDYFTFLVFQQIIGSWDRTLGGGRNIGSALCEKVATEGLATSISTFNTCYNTTGLFGVQAVTDQHNGEDCVSAILREWNRIGKTVLDSEVDRAKKRLKASLLMSLDGTLPILEDIGRQMLTNGRRLTPAEVFLRIDAVTPKDIMRVASDHCEDSDPVVVAIGTTAEVPDYNHMREWTFWRRW